MIKQDEIVFDKDWYFISEECKDLISNLLQKDPADRISLKEALKHDWF